MEAVAWQWLHETKIDAGNFMNLGAPSTKSSVTQCEYHLKWDGPSCAYPPRGGNYMIGMEVIAEAAAVEAVWTRKEAAMRKSRGRSFPILAMAARACNMSKCRRSMKMKTGTRRRPVYIVKLVQWLQLVIFISGVGILEVGLSGMDLF